MLQHRPDGYVSGKLYTLSQEFKRISKIFFDGLANLFNDKIGGHDN